MNCVHRTQSLTGKRMLSLGHMLFYLHFHPTPPHPNRISHPAPQAGLPGTYNPLASAFEELRFELCTIPYVSGAGQSPGLPVLQHVECSK